MTYNPHFHHFFSPNIIDQQLGASDQWPLTPALLLLDSFPPSSRPAILLQAAEHAPGVWILRRAQDGDLQYDLAELQRVRAVMLLELPSKSIIIHKDNCWEEAHWDTYPAPFKTQLWFISGQLASQHRVTFCAVHFRQNLRRCSCQSWQPQTIISRHCGEGVSETLNHFACVCPKFHEPERQPIIKCGE
jgi:hypothetical protein